MFFSLSLSLSLILSLSFWVIPTINDLHHLSKKNAEDHGEQLLCFLRRAHFFLHGHDDEASIFFLHEDLVLSTWRAKASTDFNPL